MSEWPGTPVAVDEAQWPGRPAPASAQPYSGSILPFSRDERGNVRFDSDAGLLGSIKRAVTLPRDVYTGKIDPMSDEGIGRSLELGTLAGPVNPAVRIGDRAIPGPHKAMRREEVEPPTAEALKETAERQYETARGMGVDYSSRAVNDAAQAIQFGLEKDGILAELAPKSFAIIRKLQDPPEGSVAPLAGLEAARRALGHAARDFQNPTEQMAARRAIDALDDFIARGATPDGAGAVVAGPAAAAAETQFAARGNYAAAKRSDQLHGIEETAERRAKVANSGQNTDNAIRQRVAGLLEKPKQSGGYSPEEIAALEVVAEGTWPRNITRGVGNLLGGGGGLGAVVTSLAGGGAGLATGSPSLAAVGAAAPALGYSAKQLANALTKRSLKHADELVRMRSPLYEQMVNDASMVPLSPERRAALVRALMVADQSNQ